MTKTDLLIALGKIDEKYINRAFEKAVTESMYVFDKKTEEKVGIMDEKKHFRKKFEPIIAIAASVVLCVGVLIFITMRNDKDKLSENSGALSISESDGDTQQSAEINVIDEELGTLVIEGMEIQLPCAYADLPIHPAYDEADWIAPSVSEQHAGMYEQQICFKVNETSENLYYLYSTYPEGGNYQDGTVYIISLSYEGTALTYKDEVFVCGETTAEEVEAKLGTQYTQQGVLRNYYYEDGFVSVFITDGKVESMMIRSTSEPESETDLTETKNAYEQGYNDGYSIGYNEGYSMAYDEGYAAAAEEIYNGNYSTEERQSIWLSGEFTVTVHDFVPFYGNNPEENSLAVVSFYQDVLFLICIDESIADEIETSTTYVFTVEDHPVFAVLSHYINNGQVSPEILRIPYVEVTDYRIAEEHELGMASLCNLTYEIKDN